MALELGVAPSVRAAGTCSPASGGRLPVRDRRSKPSPSSDGDCVFTTVGLRPGHHSTLAVTSFPGHDRGRPRDAVRRGVHRSAAAPSLPGADARRDPRGIARPSESAAPERVYAALDATGAAFGDLVGAIGIAIALAAVIGDALLRSGAADRIADRCSPPSVSAAPSGAGGGGLRALDPGVLRHRVLPAHPPGPRAGPPGARPVPPCS